MLRNIYPNLGSQAQKPEIDLIPLFNIQKKLDNHILDKFPELKEENLFDKRVLSLQIELGELANELPEVFKFWSHKKNNYKDALVEYVDCLHFILSIGNEIEYPKQGVHASIGGDIVSTFINLQGIIVYVRNMCQQGHINKAHNHYQILLNEFIHLGELIGFTWADIKQAYLDKNKENYERQENGY